MKGAVFLPEWEKYLDANLPVYRKLPEEIRGKLQVRIARFLACTRFEGCGGLEITDEIKVTIGAQACMLILNMEGDPYPALNSILVYPSSFQSSQIAQVHGHVVTERETVRLGESWDSGSVILAWDSVAQGGRNMYDGHNVSYHEFAHQLDQADGSTDGVPTLNMGRDDINLWCRIMYANYTELKDLADRGRKSVIDDYGATNAPEFFASATEAFFEKPVQMKKKLPELYLLLEDYFRVDPVSWMRPG